MARRITDPWTPYRFSMTLIIVAANGTNTVLGADRRLTANGAVRDEESNKAMTLVTRDSRALVGFTGIAEAGSFKTRFWLGETLAELAPPDHTIDGMVERLRIAATDKLQSLRVTGDKRLAVLVAGYRYSQGLSVPFWINVHNWSNNPEGLPEFVVQQEPEPRGTANYVVAIGYRRALRDSHIDQLRPFVNGNKPVQAIASKIVEVMRTVAADPNSDQMIGGQCSTVALPADTTQPALVDYHTMHPTDRMYGVGHVEARGGQFGGYVVMDPMMKSGPPDETGQPIRVQKVGRNWPCPCGSGKKYKRCHGR
jgi:hypothetical protein